MVQNKRIEMKDIELFNLKVELYSNDFMGKKKSDNSGLIILHYLSNRPDGKIQF